MRADSKDTCRGKVLRVIVFLVIAFSVAIQPE